MSDLFEMTFYAQDPKGRVHSIKTRTATDIVSMEAFRKVWPATGFWTRTEHEVRDTIAINKELVARRGTEPEVKGELGYAFAPFNGLLSEHASVKAFFAAIGYDATAKRKVRSAYNRWKKAAFLPDGALQLIDTTPFRVALGA